jgi:predicted dehydrogenase/threonine dehydrogenase-like Zn-dependent dehydrogenase
VLELLDVPCPRVAARHLLIQSRASLISAGTERSLVEFGNANLLSKARQQPEKVQQVLDKIKADGLLPTLEAVFTRLDEPLPLGYCNAGVVSEVGPEVTGLAVGDRVASNGPHAEMVHVPVNLCARIPENVPDDDASFAVLGSIALQGIRLAAPALGESVAVFGLGLVGQLTVQMLIASGVRVLGIDLDPKRLELAERCGARPVDLSAGADPVRVAESFTDGHGLDAVLVTASARNDDIVNQSARMSRKSGRIVMVGVTNLALNRAEFYEKELSFQVSCSYGPGRYDPDYEQGGIDYPYAFVRWTEQRNMAAVLRMMANGQLDVAPLISRRTAHADAATAYQLLRTDKSLMGLVLQYPQAAVAQDRIVVVGDAARPQRSAAADKVVAGIIGAGAFTKRVLLPCLRKTGAELASIASASGVSASHAARKFSAGASTSDYRTILDDRRINTVFITTRHHQHAPMVVEALRAGKHVFVEKPLAIDQQGLQDVQDAFAATDGQQLMVGFNRRFSPHAVKIRQLLTGRSQPVCMIMTVNAGHIPSDHWMHDPQAGGGRIIGEGCHWIDLLGFLVESPVTGVKTTSIGDVPGVQTRNDHVSISLAFQDGSIANLNYFANGHRTYPKETLTVFAEGKTLELDNFRSLRGYGYGPFRRMKLLRQDKGHQAELQAFVDRVQSGGEPLMDPRDIWCVTRASLQAEADVT